MNPHHPADSRVLKLIRDLEAKSSRYTAKLSGPCSDRTRIQSERSLARYVYEAEAIGLDNATAATRRRVEESILEMRCFLGKEGRALLESWRVIAAASEATVEERNNMLGIKE